MEPRVRVLYYMMHTYLDHHRTTFFALRNRTNGVKISWDIYDLVSQGKDVYRLQRALYEEFYLTASVGKVIFKG